jgi:serine/threonine protein kinase
MRIGDAIPSQSKISLLGQGEIKSYCRLCQREILHGGLKLTNILITNSGQACVADYGMVEIKGNATSNCRYFSPEAWKGVRFSVENYFLLADMLVLQTISAPSDVFAFAMSSYEVRLIDCYRLIHRSK